MGFHADLIAKDLHAPSNHKVENNSGAPIAKMRAVRIAGLGTNYLQIELGDGLSNVISGITWDVISNVVPINVGFICSLGILTDLDTSAFLVGDFLYAGPSGVLQTAPNGPIVAQVLISSATIGMLYVQIPPAGTGVDQKVKVTSNDTTTDYLQPKLVAGTNITITLQNPGGNENLKFDVATPVGTGLVEKSGVIPGASFTGSPRKFTVVFSTPFADANYAITITGGNARSWTYETKTAAGFIVNANAAAALADEVSWHAIHNGEST